MSFVRAQGRQLLQRLHTACKRAAIPIPQATTPCDVSAHAAAACRQPIRTLSSFEARPDGISVAGLGLAGGPPGGQCLDGTLMHGSVPASGLEMTSTSTDILWTPHGLHAVPSPITAGISAALQGSATHSSSMLAALQLPSLGSTAEPAQDRRLDSCANALQLSNMSQQHEVDGSQISDGGTLADTLQCVKRTYQPSVIIRKRRHGYLARIRTVGGRRVLKRRQQKGRWRPSA